MNRASRGTLLKPKLLAVSVAACFALAAAPLRANPTGPSVVHGNVGFNGLGTSALTISNQAGGNAIINWNGFSIGINELTRFQQFANLAVLNRVTGADISSILGSLQSDGRVFLINPNGIVFGASARIDVAGMVASSLGFSDQDFLAGRLRFTEVPGAGAVVNNGVIETAAGGRVYLVAPTVENNGLIQSPQGAIVLAAGKEVELVDAASPFVTVKVAAAEQAVNVGDLVADGGQIGMFGALVRNSGVVEAGGAVAGPGGEIRLVAAKDLNLEAGGVVSANGTSGGKVLLQAEGGTNLVGGTAEARGNSGRGGEVSALGVRVGVVGHGVIDASGDSGGGTVLVGGDYQGKNSSVQNAERAYIGADGVIRADAMTTGDGGRVVVWAEGDTRYSGNISAKGGAQAGDGGFAEVSGKEYLDYRGRVDLRAPNGKVGTLLIDPQDITIVYGGAVSNADISEDGEVSPFTFTSIGVGSTTLTDGSINAQLSESNVLVQTGGSGGNGDITFDAYGGEVGLNGGSGNNLTFDAARNISFVNGRTHAFLSGGQLTLRAKTGSITSATENDVLFPSGSPLLLIAGNGIGSGATPLQTLGVLELSAMSDNNGIYIKNVSISNSDLSVTSMQGSDLSGAPFVEGLRTTNGEIRLETVINDGGGGIALVSPVNSGTARVTLTAEDQIYSYYGGGPSIIAGELVMSAANGIGCDQCLGDGETSTQNPLVTQVSSLQATNQSRGIEIHNIGDLVLRDHDESGYAMSNSDGAVIISTTGNLTVAGSIEAGRRFSLIADGHLTIAEDINGGPGGGEGSNPSVLIADADDNRTGGITQSAGSSIVSDNELEISVVCSFGCENGGGGPSGQHITLGAVDALGNDILVRNEHGGIFANGGGKVAASGLMLRAEQGIDLDTTVQTLQVRHALKDGSGAVTIRNMTVDGETLVLDSFFRSGEAAIENGNGPISISSDGSIDIANTVDSGSARTTLSSGDEILSSASGFYGGAIKAGELVLSAVDGIGRGGDRILTEVSSLQATNTNQGIEIENIGSLTLANLGAGYAVQNSNGALILSSDGSISVNGSVTVGRRIDLRANGDLAINANLTGHQGGETSSAVDLVADADSNGIGAIAGTGNIVANGGDLFASGVSVTLGSINANATSPGDRGSDVTIQATGGAIAINGSISSLGANGAGGSEAGGGGGDVDLSAPGPITVTGTMDASGGNGVASAFGFTGFGGGGGSIDVSGSTIALGGVRSRGGDGGASLAYAGGITIGGAGGQGGAVRITGTGEFQVNVGGTLGAVAIDVSGGAGGGGNVAASPAGNGGTGGNGGSVIVVGTPNMTLFGSVLAGGGDGGAGGAGNPGIAGGNGGNAGSGGSVFLDASSVTDSRTGDGIIFVLAGTQFNVQGGLGGSGGANGGLPGISGTSKTFIQGSDYFGTIIVLDPLSIPEINQAVQQIADDAATAFVGGEKEDEEEDKSQKELASCKG